MQKQMASFLATLGTTVLVEDEVVRVIGNGDPSLRRIGDTDHAAAFLDGMAKALRTFGRQIPGYDTDEGILVGPETRGSSPVAEP